MTVTLIAICIWDPVNFICVFLRSIYFSICTNYVSSSSQNQVSRMWWNKWCPKIRSENIQIILLMRIVNNPTWKQNCNLRYLSETKNLQCKIFLPYHVCISIPKLSRDFFLSRTLYVRGIFNNDSINLISIIVISI